MQKVGEQLDSAILAYAILLQLMHCSIASCILHIACCVGVRSPLNLLEIYLIFLLNSVNLTFLLNSVTVSRISFHVEENSH